MSLCIIIFQPMSSRTKTSQISNSMPSIISKLIQVFLVYFTADSCDPLPIDPNAEHDIFVESAVLKVLHTCRLGWVIEGGLREKKRPCCFLTGRTERPAADVCRGKHVSILRLFILIVKVITKMF